MKYLVPAFNPWASAFIALILPAAAILQFGSLFTGVPVFNLAIIWISVAVSTWLDVICVAALAHGLRYSKSRLRWFGIVPVLLASFWPAIAAGALVSGPVVRGYGG